MKKIVSCHDANFVTTHWLAQEIVMMTTYSADKTGIMTTLIFSITLWK